jgi:hypothetical protein
LETTLAVLEQFRAAFNGLHSSAEGWADPLGFAAYAPADGRTRLRSLLATMDQELASSDLSALRTAFATLVAELGLGPELRSCPKCHHLSMRAATRCSTCWSSLIPQ